MRTLELLAPRAGAKLFDGTFGGGGHTCALLEASEEVAVVAIDRDPEATVRAEAIKKKYRERFRFYSMDFGDLAGLEETGFDGVLFDFGVSSFQLDVPERGFSFRMDAPADMRMDPNGGISAAEFLETAEEKALVRAIRNYGEEKRWRRVVSAIIEARGTGRLQRTGSLAELIAEAVDVASGSRGSVHPATRSFQGIRIQINNELSAIEPWSPCRIRSPLAWRCFGGHQLSFSGRPYRETFLSAKWLGRPEHSHDTRTQDERTTLARMISTGPLKPSEAEIP